jgi:hypothetical protein
MPHLGLAVLAMVVGVVGLILKKAIELILENEYSTWAPALARLLIRIAGFVHRRQRKQWWADLHYMQRVKGESGLLLAGSCFLSSPWLGLRHIISVAQSKPLIRLCFAVVTLGVVMTITRSIPTASPQSVFVAVQPASHEGHCPSADFVFRGAIRTNGAPGSISFVWDMPDGETTPARSVQVDAGTMEVLQSLRFTFAGQQAATGSVRLRVVSPREMASVSAPARFQCP